MTKVKIGQVWEPRDAKLKIKAVIITNIIDGVVRWKQVEGNSRITKGKSVLHSFRNRYTPRLCQNDLWWLVTDRSTEKWKVERIPKWAQSKLEPVQNGFGFYGVLLCDPYEDRIQCHICGRWYKFLGGHVNGAHGVTAEDYKAEFELGRIGLASIEYLTRAQEHAREIGLHESVKGNVLDNIHPEKRQQQKQSLRGSLMVGHSSKKSEHRHNVSEAQKRRYQDPEQKRARKELLDRIRPSATVKLKGRGRSQRTKTAISDKLKGRSLSKEHKEALSRAAKRRVRKTKEEREAELLEIFKINPRATYAEIKAKIGLSYGGIGVHIRRMIAEEKIERTAQGVAIKKNAG